MSEEKIPFQKIRFFRRQRMAAGVWDIREFPPYVVVMNWINFISFCLLMLVFIFVDFEGSGDEDTLKYVLFCVLLFIIYYFYASNSGVVIDSYRHRIWLWKRRVFFVTKEAIPWNEYKSSLIFVDFSQHNRCRACIRVMEKDIVLYYGRCKDAELFAFQLRLFMQCEDIGKDIQCGGMYPLSRFVMRSFVWFSFFWFIAFMVFIHN